MAIDPIRYEMFRHRLFNIAEEGRIAIQQVSASPPVVEGGECMSSFYDPSGTVIISAAGLLLHCTGCQDAIKAALTFYEEDPGIFDGDQLFFNDPYIAATHVYDQLVIKPIFYQGRRIAWTASMMHTADTGGVLRGAATEIFHEGIRFQGIKVVEAGKFRKDVFRNIVQQVRDPDYVGLDLKAKIAANNVCARAFLNLVEKYGVEFVEEACQKIIGDSEKQARARLRSLPDGTWRSRVHALAHPRNRIKPYRVVCTMTKKGDTLDFDFTGTSPQNEDASNCTLPCSWSSLFTALTGHLFYDIAWNGGMFAPISLRIPEGTVLNCRYPAACGQGPATGATLYTAAHECIVKMLYTGGHYDDVNATWTSPTGSERRRFGGHDQHGGVAVQQIYDFFACGLGASPSRDGVNTGGNMLNPQSKISDVELVEMNYPLLYLSRNEVTDSAGPGRNRGGVGMEKLMMVYGSQDFTDNYWAPYGVPLGFGLSGGYPCTLWEARFITVPDVQDRLARGEYPRSFPELVSMVQAGQAQVYPPADATQGRVSVPEFTILGDRAESGGGGGYGDPLERDPAAVERDVRLGYVSPAMARDVHGVALAADGAVDQQATRQLRAALRRERLSVATTAGVSGT